MLNNLPGKWSLETDLIAIGSGIGGLSAAITAHRHGAHALVLERSEKLGGVTALSMGEVWVPGNHLARELGIEDSSESGFRYLERLSMGYGDERAIRNIAVHAPAALKHFEEQIGLKMAVIRNCPDYYFGRSNDGVAEGRMLEPQPIGVDFVSMDGFECAGHPGEDDIPALVLIPMAAKALKVPIIASGGIADGRGMAAALVLGAEGVNMGTRFVCTREAPVHENIKEAMVSSSERDTRLIFRTLHNTARVLRNAVSDEVVAMERRPGGCTFAEIKHLVAGTRGKAAWESVDLDGGVLTAGMVIGLIDDVPSCEELIERIVRDCSQRLQHAAACLDSDLRLDLAPGA